MKNFYLKTKLGIIGVLFSVILFGQNYSSGIFILNEGGAGSGNASLSFLNPEGELENDAFSNANSGLELGDTAQGLGVYEGKVYIAVNISHTVVIADQTTLEHITTISEGIQNPRYITFKDEFAYVTCWGNPGDPSTSYVAVIDLNTNAVDHTISVTEGPETILEHDGKLYVAHKGGYGQGNTVSVIDIATEEVTSVTVGDVPNSMVVLDNTLYVLCAGNPSWSPDPTNSSFYKINLETVEPELIFDFSLQGPAFLSYDGESSFYYTSGNQVFKMDTTATEVPAEYFIQTPIEGWGGAYGFNVINGVAYVADAGDYVSPGTVYTYSADNGAEIDSYTVGIIPNGFYLSEHIDMGVSDAAFAQVQIYPNPASDLFYVDAKDVSDVKIYDLTGRILKSTSNVSGGIKVNDLPKGVYIVKVQSGKSILTKKLIIR